MCLMQKRHLSHEFCFAMSHRAVDHVFSVNELTVVAVQSFSHVQLFVTPWTAACQASLSFTVSWNLLKLMSIESVMPSKHLTLCCPLLLLTSIFPGIKIFSNELALRIWWKKMDASALVLPMSIQGWFPLGFAGLIFLLSTDSSVLNFLYGWEVTS